MEAVSLDTLPARMVSRIQVHPVSGCWLYQGYVNKDGYATVKIAGKTKLVHRAVVELATGKPLPREIELDHMRADRPVAPGPCIARNCCNPEHLEPVSPAENKRRVVQHNSTKTHCPKGHSYAEHGFARKCGRRGCRECERARKLRLAPKFDC